MSGVENSQPTPRAPWRFQRLLVALFSIGIFCVAILGGLLNSWSAGEEVRKKLVDQGRQVADSLARQSTLALLYGQGENAREAVNATMGFPGVTQVVIYDKNNGVLLNQGQARGDMPALGEAELSAGQVHLQETQYAWHFASPVFSEFESGSEESPFVLDSAEPELLGYVRVVVDKKGMHVLQQEMFVRNFVGMFAAAAILLLLMLWLASRLTRPLDDLAGLMKRAEQGESRVRAAPRGPWEVQHMARSFNTMMSTLEKRADRLDEQNAMLIQDMEAQKRAELERAQLQEQLQQARKMEALGQLTGGIAHDFNNMLASILGYTELALGGIRDKPPEKIASYLEEVRLAGERARDLISQMLTFSRQGSSSPKSLDVIPMVKEVVKMLGSILPASIELRTEFGRDLPQVRIDPVHLHQVVMNLCINARDAMEDAGVMTIRILSRPESSEECTSCHTSFSGDFVELAVIDTGAGIKQEDLSNIFDPFYTTKEVGKGSGMGLSVVHGIIHEHGGHVVVESARSAGTAFRLLFPAVEAETTLDKVDEKPARDESERAGGRVMVVDDERLVGRFLKELLESAGYTVFLHSDPLLAFTQFREHPDTVDLVITDQTMPKLSGVDLAKRLLEIRPTLPVILCTGYSAHVDEERAQNLHIKRFMHKPLDADTLLAEVGTLLESEAVSRG